MPPVLTDESPDNSPRALTSAARLAALQRLRLLDSPAEPSFDRLTRLAVQVLGAPLCLVSLVDDRRQFFKSAVGLGGPVGEARETPLTHSFCQHVVTSGAPLAVENASQHPLVCDNLAIRDLGVQAYLGVPIYSPDGFVLGSFCVIDVKPRAWTPRDLELVKEFTGLLETEIALRASRIGMERSLTRYRAVLDGTDFSVIATNAEGLIEEFNAGAEKMLGYRAEEMIGKQTPEVIHVFEEVAARAAELGTELGRRIEPGFEVFVARARLNQADEREWTYVRKDGTRLPVILNATALRDATGTITGYLGIARDNAERRRGQAELARLAELQRQTSELAKVGGWELNLATMQPVWSEETCRIHEVDPPVTPPMTEAINFYAPEARPVIEAAVMKCVSDGTPWDLELPLITAKGRRIWVRAQGQALSVQGKRVKLMGAFQDITDRKFAQLELERAAERFRRLGAQVPGMIYQFRMRPDGSGAIPYASEGIRDIYGLAPEEVREDAAPIFATLHPDDAGAVRASVQESARTLNPWRGEFRVRDKAGKVRWVFGNAMPGREPDGSVLWHGFISDITDRKAVDLQVQLSEERLRLATEAAGVAVWEWHVGRDAITWDNRMFAIYGIAPTENGEVTYRTWFDSVLPDDAPEQSQQLRVLLASGGRNRRGFRIRRRSDGAIRHVQASELRVEGQGSVRVVGVNIDVTERVEAELQLRQTQLRLETTFSSMSEGLVLQGTAGSILECNAAAERILGLTRDQMTGRTSLDPEWRCVRADGTEFPGGEHPAMVTLATGQAQRDVVMGVQRGDGSLRWIEINSELIGSAGDGGRQVVCSFRDVTERREAEAGVRASEERFRTLTQNAPVGIFETDAAGRCQFVNERWSATAGLTMAEAAGDGWLAALHPEDRPAIFAAWEAFARGERPFHMEYRFRHRDGRVVWVAGSAVALHDGAGGLRGYLGTVSNITERKELEAKLALARDQALEASRLKSEFLATMSHEIRTPMNAVIGMAGLLEDTPLSLEQGEMVRTMIGGAENLLTIINDVLDFSRIEAGKMRLDPTEFDFRRIVEETVALLAGRAHEKEVEITCEVQTAPKTMLLGDGGRVRQVLTNLIGNAIKFTDVGEVAVRVRVVAESAKRTRLRVAVRDTGIGIAPEVRARLFQPFSQVDGSSTRRFGGTGLGLAISRQLVELMGGEIGFESEVGKGSEFWIELEFAEAGPTNAAPAVEIPSGLRVLVVDDNETNRRILLGQLTGWGVAVEAVGGGEAALARLRDRTAGPWSLVLLDWHMPGMSGLELAMEIQADRTIARLPMVMLSSAGPHLDVSTAAAAGFAAFLTKPVTALQLSRCITRVMKEAAPGDANDGRALGKAEAGPVRDRATRLLLVEDNPANQRVAMMLLAKMGYAVEVVGNGQLALAALANGETEAVLMDCQMPVMDGYEATRRIRAGAVAGIDPKLPIIALTAYARAEDRARCLAVGMDDYVTKPIRAAELRMALERRGLAVGIIPRPATSTGENEAGKNFDPVLDEQALESARELPGLKGASLLPELVEMYLADERRTLERLGQLVSERRTELLADEAHSFGGGAASFGGTQVRRVALELERVARAGDWPAVNLRWSDLKGACERLRSEVARRKLLGV